MQCVASLDPTQQRKSTVGNNMSWPSRSQRKFCSISSEHMKESMVLSVHCCTFDLSCIAAIYKLSFRICQNLKFRSTSVHLRQAVND